MVEPEVTAQFLCRLMTVRQSEAKAMFKLIDLHETLENGTDFVPGDATTRILHNKVHRVIIAFDYTQLDMSLLCELDGVFQQTAEHPLKTVGIGVEHTLLVYTCLKHEMNPCWIILGHVADGLSAHIAT